MPGALKIFIRGFGGGGIFGSIFVSESDPVLQNDALPVQTIERPSFKMTLNATANPDELERYLIPGREGIVVSSESSIFKTGRAPGAEKKDENQYRVFGVSRTAEKLFVCSAAVVKAARASQRGVLQKWAVYFDEQLGALALSAR